MEFSDKDIQDYIEGTLSFNKKEAFNEALKHQDDLVERLAEQTLGEYTKIKLKNKLSKIGKEVRQERRKRFKYTLVAAMIAIIAIPSVIGIIEDPFNFHLFSNHYEPVSDIPTSYHEQNHPHSKGFVSYLKGDYVQALNYFNQAETKQDDIYFYEGLSYLSLSKDEQNAQKAIESFKKVEENSEYKEDALWYKSLSYLLLNRVEKAKNALTRLVKKNNRKSTKAQELLDKLE